MAVSLVVAYHFGLPASQSGFVGVDVFFVISGFLITHQIHSNLENERLLLLEFAARRIRRVVPPLLLVCFATLLLGMLLLSPRELETLGHQIATAAVGASNVYFYFESDYFAPEAGSLPLLHTWSLGVEEQFYLVWPLLLLLGYAALRARRVSTVLIACIVILASFSATLFVVEFDQPFAFFMLPTRAWQLATGGLVAMLPPIRSRLGAEFAGWLGIGLIVGAASSEISPASHPDASAVVPTLGAALLLLCRSPSSFAQRSLSLRPLVWIGLISYGLYLWHWPLLVFWGTWTNGEGPTLAETTFLLIAACVFATASFLLIERPLRRAPLRPAVMLKACLCGAGLVALFGVALNASGGVPQRLTAEGQRIASFATNPGWPKQTEVCSLHRNREISELPCLKEDYDGPRVLIAGDSHAHHFVVAFASINPDVRVYRAVATGCRPVRGGRGSEECTAFVRRLLDDIVPAQAFDAVILSARWGNGDHDLIAETVREVSESTERTIVLGQTNEFVTDLPDLLLANELPRRSLPTGEDAYRSFDRHSTIDEEMSVLVSDAGGEYYSVLQVLCSSGACRTLTDDGVPMTWDRAHFTVPGAIHVLSEFQGMGLVFGN